MKRGSIFELDGVPRLREAAPLALQHVVAMIVGCVTPAIIVAGAVGDGGLKPEDRVILIQASLVMSAIATLLQLFPIGKKSGFAIGSGLPMIMGVSFAYVPSMQAIAEGYGCGCYFWRPDRGRYRSSCNGTSGPADKGVLSASDHRNCCIYDRSFSLSHCY